MLDDLHDVEDEDFPIVKTAIVDWKQNKWSPWRPHLACVNCQIRIDTLKSRKFSSCCGGNNTPHFYTINERQWKQHMETHYRYGHAVAEEDWNLTL